MSLLYARDTIRTWAAQSFVVPFIDTINAADRPANGAAIWASVQFDPETETKLSFCDDMEAAGQAEFIFCGLPGQGDAEVLAAAESSIAALLARQASDLVLLYARSPTESSAGSADHTYRISIGVEYRHYYRMGADDMGIPEAPLDGKEYVRKNGQWVEAKPGEAPLDGTQYGRQSAAWTAVTGGGGSTAWGDITGKPATFPPTLPIAQTGVTNLVTDLAGKEPAITAGTSAQYWRGDKMFQTLDKAAVGLANVDNTADAAKPVSTATQTALNAKAPLASPALTGAATINGVLIPKITVGTTAPASPAVNDLWVDTN